MVPSVSLRKNCEGSVGEKGRTHNEKRERERGREGEGEAENPVEKQKRERLESKQISINQSAVLILLPGYY